MTTLDSGMSDEKYAQIIAARKAGKRVWAKNGRPNTDLKKPKATRKQRAASRENVKRANKLREARKLLKEHAEKAPKAGSIAAPAVLVHTRPDGRVARFEVARFLDFCNQLLIQSKDSGVVHFELLGSQKYVLDQIVEGLRKGVTTFVVLKGRQQGISTLFLALDLFEAFEHPGTIGVFATHDEGSRDQFRNQIEVFLTGLPKTHKIEYDTNNRLMLVLKNLSMFRYLVAGTRTTTNKLGRSGGCNYCHATETAFWGSADDLKALMQTFSETYPHRKYFFESTANGFNHFQEMYEIADDSPAQMAIFSGWWRDERNEFSAEHPLYPQYMPQGTRTPLSTFEKQKIREVKEQYGFTITAGQVAWYRFHLETKCGGDQSMMNQEQPWTAEDAFISTGSSFFTSPVLTDLSKEAKKHPCLPFVFRINDRFEDIQLQKVSDTRRCDLKIWEMPVAGAKYVIGADPIFGSSDNRDNGVITIGRAYADCIVQVAEYVSPSISAFQYAWIIAFLAGLYDEVYLVLEITGPGAVVYEELKQLRQKLARITPGQNDDIRNCMKHMKHFMYTRSDSLSPSYFLQWKSSEELRRQMLNLFRDGITAKRLHVRSMHLIDEMRYLMIDGGDIQCPANKQDDRVFGVGLMYWGWDRTVRRRIWRNDGMTLIETKKREEIGDPNQIVGMAQRFLKDARINVPQ